MMNIGDTIKALANIKPNEKVIYYTGRLTDDCEIPFDENGSVRLSPEVVGEKLSLARLRKYTHSLEQDRKIYLLQSRYKIAGAIKGKSFYTYQYLAIGRKDQKKTHYEEQLELSQRASQKLYEDGESFKASKRYKLRLEQKKKGN